MIERSAKASADTPHDDPGGVSFSRRVKAMAVDILRHCPPAFRLSSRLLHRLNGSYRTLSPGAPEAILKAFQYLIDRDGKVSGDYYEFGLFRGYTFQQAYQHCQDLGLKDVRFHGFDSFTGLPPAEGIDQTDGRFFKGQFACGLKEVESNLETHGVDLSHVNLIKGYYEDSLTPALREQHPFKHAAVVMLDCDYYTSTVTALTWMEPYLRPGTVLLFDDWYSYGDTAELGQQKAYQEFLERHPEYESETLWEFKHHGIAFVLKEADSA